MFDDQPVHRTMERIFTPLGSIGTATPVPPPARTPEAPAPRRRRWFMGRDGIAAVGFALTVTVLGMVMVPLLSTPAPPPSAPSPSAPPPMVARVPAAVPAPPPAPPQPAPLPTTAPVAAAPVVVALASPVVETPRPRAGTIRTRTRTVRRHRARPGPSRYRRREAPRLAGAALRRALARDVVLTRRLNQAALRRLRDR